AIAGVVAIVGAISVYISMNNDEQDVKNILVLQNWLERITDHPCPRRQTDHDQLDAESGRLHL
ncbi:MAG: DUF4134 family protein, partial [Lachnospiraceae bacterium]|nr:DUF4134 family protein [Lachnospiraceae bacterium]